MIYLDKPKVLLFLLGTLLFLILPHLPHLPLPVLLIMGSAGFYRYLIYRFQRPNLSRHLTGLLALAAAGVIFVSFGRYKGADVMVAFYATMVFFKLLESRTDRDTLLVICLSYLLLGTAFIFKQDLWTLPYLLTGTTLLSTILVGVQFPDGLRQIKHSLRTACGLILLATPLAILMFLIVPRGGGLLWSLGNQGFQKTGLTDRVDFSSMSSLNQDNTIAFRVDFKEADQLHDRYYWRAIVYGAFDGYTWEPAGLPVNQIWTSAVAAPPIIEYTITIEPHQQPWLFSLDLPINVPPDAAMNNERQLVLRRNQKVMTRWQYDLKSAESYKLGQRLSPREQRLYLSFPRDLNPKTIALAEKWRAQCPSDSAYMQAVLTHISKTNFYYTLDPGTFDATHAIDDFWFEKQRGYCQHYASAFALLMRAGGLPARLVGGYQGGEINPVNNYLMVRQRHAHAWVEVFLPTQGWVRVDPTAAIAPQRTEPSLQSALQAMQTMNDDGDNRFNNNDSRPNSQNPAFGAKSINFWDRLGYQIDGLNHSWNSWVLNYDADKRAALFKALGSEKLKRYWWLILTVTIACFLLIMGFIFQRRNRYQVDQIQLIYTLFCKKLAKKGVIRGDFEGPRDFIERAKAKLPEKAAQLDAIYTTYIALRFAPITTKSPAIKTFRKLVKSLK